MGELGPPGKRGGGGRARFVGPNGSHCSELSGWGQGPDDSKIQPASANVGFSWQTPPTPKYDVHPASANVSVCVANTPPLECLPPLPPHHNRGFTSSEEPGFDLRCSRWIGGCELSRVLCSGSGAAKDRPQIALSANEIIASSVRLPTQQKQSSPKRSLSSTPTMSPARKFLFCSHNVPFQCSPDSNSCARNTTISTVESHYSVRKFTTQRCPNTTRSYPRQVPTVPRVGECVFAMRADLYGSV